MDIRTTFMPSLTTGGMAEKLKALKAEKLSAQKQAMDDVRDVPRKVRDDTRARAKEKLMQLFERMKIIKKLGENDPKMMAKLLAQAMKELKAIVKEYVRAGGNSSDVSGYAAAQVTASTPVPDETKDVEAEASDAVSEVETTSEDVPTEAVEGDTAVEATAETSETAEKPQTPLEAKTAAEAYVKTERDRAQGELMEVGEFMRLVRGFMKATKELLETAKIKLTFQKVGKDTVEDFRSSYEDMKDIEEEFEDLSKGLDDERAVFGPKSVLYA
ncbi:hypothetical protein [Asticcacaulis sp. YBE204]|uniref:hypothetical protein n=1 Tax=Asticcacaulis sp. YBE204 TaxID=1282363 RepID=UPI0003C3F3B3|nr:hypothetical protein [Asticcacaulis sp. YBE204]ESQ81063.1 hypothetical protein AEYBE204_01675 [Asticcacaulis sp. YBE204]